MSSSALGKRLRMTQSAVSQREASEQAERITLSTLRRIAAGLECDCLRSHTERESGRDQEETSHSSGD